MMLQGGISIRSPVLLFSDRDDSPLAFLLLLGNSRSNIIAHQVVPFELGRRAPAHRMLERLEHARCLQVFERVHSFQ